MPVYSWTKQNYEISTDPSLIALDALNDLFDSADFHWGRGLPLEELQALVQRSLCFVLYEVTDDDVGVSDMSRSVPPAERHNDISGDQPPPPRQGRRRLIGFARWITDMVTVAYLTDVYILPSCRNRGLGAWMMRCIDETFDSMKHMRGMILIADRGSNSESLYRRHLSMDDLESPGFLMDRKGRGAASS
jgi:hypothetical protein